MSGKGESAAPTTGAITWKDGDKHLCIMPGTWALKTIPERIAAAKEDLKRAGHVVEAELLNKGSLNTAWQKLSDDLKLKYKALRDQQPPVPRAEKKKTAAKRERDERRQGLKFEVWARTRNFADQGTKTDSHAEAQGNLAVAQSLGLASGQFGAAVKPQPVEEEVDMQRFQGGMHHG